MKLSNLGQGGMTPIKAMHKPKINTIEIDTL